MKKDDVHKILSFLSGAAVVLSLGGAVIACIDHYFLIGACTAFTAGVALFTIVKEWNRG